MMTAPSSFFTGTTSTRHGKQLPAERRHGHCATRRDGPPDPEGACPLLPPPRLPHTVLPLLAIASCPTPSSCHLPARAASPIWPLQLSAFKALPFPLCLPWLSSPLSRRAFSPHCLLLLSSWVVSPFSLSSRTLSLLFLMQGSEAWRLSPQTLSPGSQGSDPSSAALSLMHFSYVFNLPVPHFPHL